VAKRHGHDGDRDGDDDENPSMVADLGGQTDHHAQSPASTADGRTPQVHAGNVVDLSSVTPFLRSEANFLGGVRVAAAALAVDAGPLSALDGDFGFLGRAGGVFVG
jgi:hypothetical protein